MKIIEIIKSTVLVVFLIVFPVLTRTAVADSAQDWEKALKIIGDFADRLCKDIPLEGQGNTFELTGGAKAELSGIIRQLVNLGIEGTAKYQNTGYTNVLQKDLANTLKTSTDCRLQVWKDLKGKFEPPKPIKTVIFDRETARFGITLGWQLARYEFTYDSPFPEVLNISPSIKQEIERLLKQDQFPHTVEGLSSQQLIDTVLLYYGTSNLKKHASVLLGIAAMRASLVGASSNQQHNDEMKQLAYSAIEDIDGSLLRRKKELFNELINTKPGSVAAVMDLLSKMKLI